MTSPVTNIPPFNEIISSFNDEEINYKKGDEKNYHSPGNLIYSPNFVLILNNYVYSFQEISGIDIEFPIESYNEGGNPIPQFAHKIKEGNFTILSLKHAMPIKSKQSSLKKMIATALFQVVATNVGYLRRNALIQAASLDPIYTLENGPANGFIQIFDRNFKNDVANFGFFSYGAQKWTLGELDATSGNIVYESIDLVCTDFRRILPSSPNVGNSMNKWLSITSEKYKTTIDEIKKNEDARQKRLSKALDENSEDKRNKRLNSQTTTIDANEKERQKRLSEDLEKNSEEKRKERMQKARDELEKIEEERKNIVDNYKKQLEQQKITFKKWEEEQKKKQKNSEEEKQEETQEKTKKETQEEVQENSDTKN